MAFSRADITASNINLPLDIMNVPETEQQDYNTDDDEGWTKVVLETAVGHSAWHRNKRE